HRGGPSLSGRGGVRGGAGPLVIVLRFLRTILGWGWIMTDTMVSALIIGIHGEGEASERVLRGWARRFLLVAGARVVVQRDAELDPDRSYVFVSNHTSNLDVPAILSVVDYTLRFTSTHELAWLPTSGCAPRSRG